jgi:hypothetical protein
MLRVLVDRLCIGEQLHATVPCQQCVVQCDGDVALGKDGQTPHTLSGHVPEDSLDGGEKRDEILSSSTTGS